MYKIILTFLFIIFLSNSVFAESKNSKLLSRIENNLFGIEYTNQSDNERLSRIEEQVYGEQKSGKFASRLSDLSNDIATNLMGQEITPKKDTFDEEDSFSKNLANNVQDEYREPDNPKIEYPTVNELEEQIFGKNYKNLDINTRLSRLENEAFKKIYNDALSDRVDRLKNKLSYIPKTSSENNFEQNYFKQDKYFSEDENYFSPQTVAQQDDYGKVDEQKLSKDVSDKEFSNKLKKIEKSVFKQTFSNDTIDNRLSRLEGAIFSTNFASDKNVTRLNRISSAVQAQKTAKKYDSNGIQQKMATAMQIGMFVLMVVAMIL